MTDDRLIKFTVGAITVLGVISIVMTLVSLPSELLGIVLVLGALLVFVIYRGTIGGGGGDSGIDIGGDGGDGGC